MSSEWEDGVVDDALRHLMGESSGWNFDSLDSSGWSANLNFTSTPSNNTSSLDTSAADSQHTQSNQTASSSTLAPVQSTVSATSYASSQQPPGPSHRRSTQPTFSTRGLAPISERAEFTENWLDLREEPPPDTFDYITGIAVGVRDNDSHRPPPSESSTGVDDNDMPATTRSRGQRGNVVDLTADQSSPAEIRPSRPSSSLKRPAAESSGRNRSPKRNRTGGVTDVEELDLTGGSPTAEEEVLQDQQAKAIAAQSGDPAGPVKIAQRTCNICMETLTDATVTSCGHMYCHECLTQALIASERTTANPMGKCPNCRKALSRKKANNMIPIAFMKKSAYETRGRPSTSG